MKKMKVSRFPLASKIMAFVGFSLCLAMMSSLDFTRADSALAVNAQVSSSPEFRKLLKDQKLDLKVLVHLQKSEFNGFKVAQDVELREWESREKKERHKFFTDHPAGAERRTYIQDFMKRRDALLRKIASEKSEKIKEQNEKMKSFREEQEEAIKKFKENAEAKKAKAQEENQDRTSSKQSK